METRRRGDLSPRLYNGKLDPRNRYCGKHAKLSVTDRDPRNDELRGICVWRHAVAVKHSFQICMNKDPNGDVEWRT